MELSMQSLVGRQIQAVTESSQAVTVRTTDGNQTRIPKGPLQDLRSQIDNWNKLLVKHVGELIPPAHQGWYIIDFGEDNGPTTCSGVLTGSGNMVIPPGYSGVRVTAKAGMTSTAIPAGLSYEILAGGEVKVNSGTALIENVTSTTSQVVADGAPGLVVTIQANLEFTYKLAGDTVARAGSMVVSNVTRIPDQMSSQVPVLMLQGQMTLPDGTRISGVRQTGPGTTVGSTQETTVASTVQLGAQLKEWRSQTEETVIFQIQSSGQANTLSYSIAEGVQAPYNYCDFEEQPPTPGGTACPTDILGNYLAAPLAYMFPAENQDFNINVALRTYDAKPAGFLISSTDRPNTVEVTDWRGTRIGFAMNSQECISQDSGDTADLAVTMAIPGGATSVVMGDQFSFVVTGSNAGPKRVQGSVLAISLPAQFTYIGSSPSYAGGATGPTSVGRNGQQITLDISQLPTGGTVAVTVSCRCNVRGVFAAASTITSSIPDPKPSNNSATLDIEVR